MIDYGVKGSVDVFREMTPAFICDEKIVIEKCRLANCVAHSAGVTFLYALKAQSFPYILKIVSQFVDGFSASSLFESVLANDMLKSKGIVHLTTPGIKDSEIESLSDICDYISFNSLNQWARFKKKSSLRFDAGLRVNPQLSFVKDSRYDPCAITSRLGVPLDTLQEAFNADSSIFEGLKGIHFHTNCESETFEPLLATVAHLDKQIPELLNECQWINLGGGYLFNEGANMAPFNDAVSLLQEKYKLNVIIEPGAALVQEAGSLISAVIDLIESGGKKIAVLDTTVNHLPEVLEFEYSPDVEGCSKNGQFEYLLAGSSCLAGDQFGTYLFDKPLKIGSIVTFENVGAYSLVKAHMFNGINLPSVYSKKEDGSLELLKEYTYEDFLDRCGATISERLRKRA